MSVRNCPNCSGDSELQENMGKNGFGWLEIQWQCKECEQLFVTWEWPDDDEFKDSKGYYNSKEARQLIR